MSQRHQHYAVFPDFTAGRSQRCLRIRSLLELDQSGFDLAVLADVYHDFIDHRRRQHLGNVCFRVFGQQVRHLKAGFARRLVFLLVGGLGVRSFYSLVHALVELRVSYVNELHLLIFYNHLLQILHGSLFAVVIQELQPALLVRFCVIEKLNVFYNDLEVVEWLANIAVSDVWRQSPYFDAAVFFISSVFVAEPRPFPAAVEIVPPGAISAVLEMVSEVISGIIILEAVEPPVLKAVSLTRRRPRIPSAQKRLRSGVLIVGETVLKSLEISLLVPLEFIAVVIVLFTISQLNTSPEFVHSIVPIRIEAIVSVKSLVRHGYRVFKEACPLLSVNVPHHLGPAVETPESALITHALASIPRLESHVPEIIAHGAWTSVAEPEVPLKILLISVVEIAEVSATHSIPRVVVIPVEPVPVVPSVRELAPTSASKIHLLVTLHVLESVSSIVSQKGHRAASEIISRKEGFCSREIPQNFEIGQGVEHRSILCQISRIDHPPLVRGENVNVGKIGRVLEGIVSRTDFLLFFHIFPRILPLSVPPVVISPPGTAA